MPMNGSLTEVISTSACDENTEESRGPLCAEILERILSQIHSFSNLSHYRSKASAPNSAI
jgi:hypothetical protein